jgi:hypothetical protein
MHAIVILYPLFLFRFGCDLSVLFSLAVSQPGNALAYTTSQMGLYGAPIQLANVGYAMWNDQVYNDSLGSSV